MCLDLPTPVSLTDAVLELHYIQSNFSHCSYCLLFSPQLWQTITILQYNHAVVSIVSYVIHNNKFYTLIHEIFIVKKFSFHPKRRKFLT